MSLATFDPASDARSAPRQPADDAPSPPRQRDSLEQGLALLGCFSPEEPVLALGEIGERAELPADAVQRYAQALVARGYLERRTSGKYGLGPLALRLGLIAVRIDGLVEVARPWLCWMRARTGFTASLAMLGGDDLDYLAWLPSRRAGQSERAAEWAATHAHGLASNWTVGRRLRLSTTAHSRAAGQALLAFTAESDWPERTRVWACHAPRQAGRLRGELEDVCERRYAISRDGRETGVAAVVLGATEPIAAVELSVFGEQAREFSLRVLAGVVVAAADGIAEQLEDDSRTVA
jgi:DNA-binding IclR family transcriptional regulator